MIPRILHFCWFGGNPYTPLAEKCIASWKRHLTDFEIIEWNENNFDITANQYVQEAFESKKWAFVSDYVRLHALYHHGGVYVDADLEVLRPVDRFLTHSAFSGYESEKIIPTAIMAAEKSHPWIKLLLDDYSDRRFIQPDGSFDMTANVHPITRLTSSHYSITPNGQMLEFGEGIAIYPKDFFCPLDYSTRKPVLTENSYTIHHFSSSWFSEAEREGRLHKIAYRAHLKEKNYRLAAAEIRMAYGYSKKIKHLVLAILLSVLGALKNEPPGAAHDDK